MEQGSCAKYNTVFLLFDVLQAHFVNHICIIALLFYAIVCAVHWVAVRYSSNKNTVEKQNNIVDEFYAIAIPQLIEVKSILEQVDEDNSNDDRKKLLLLLQAKHEIVHGGFSC